MIILSIIIMVATSLEDIFLVIVQFLEVASSLVSPTLLDLVLNRLWMLKTSLKIEYNTNKQFIVKCLINCLFILLFLHSLAASIMDISDNNLNKDYCTPSPYESLFIWLRCIFISLRSSKVPVLHLSRMKSEWNWKSFFTLISINQTFVEISLFLIRLAELIYLCDMFMR